MSAVRVALAAAGVAALGWGVWLLRDDDPAGLVSLLVWAAGGVLLHDLVLAPLVVGIGLVAARTLPSASRTLVSLLLAGWGLVTVAVANVLVGRGAKPDNPSLLTGSYAPWWLALTAVVLVVAAVVVLRAHVRARGSRTTPT